MPTNHHRALSERLWSRVNKNGPIPKHVPTLGKCWIWTGFLEKTGYGQIAAGPIGVRHIRVHRLSWILTYGMITSEEYVLHKCDNPACVRPDHLFLGDDDTNKRDCCQKLRHHHGETHRFAKLTSKQVERVEKMWNTGLFRQWEIGERFGISQGHVSEIVNHIKRKHG